MNNGDGYSTFVSLFEMARLWYFNPWNDQALGTDAVHYTPQPLVECLALSGLTLPMWMASEDDYVLVDDDGRKFYETMCHKHTLARPWQGEKIDCCVPWGWSKAVKQVFIDKGVDSSVLPDDALLDQWRSLSHRRLTITAHKFFDTGLEPAEASSLKDCEEALTRWENIIGKYPWSSTGRGLFSGNPQYKTSFLGRCAGAINHQGSVMIEKAFDVVVDFAMLFYVSSPDLVTFKGLSLFNNVRRGYAGNVLTAQDKIQQELTRYISPQILDETQERAMSFIASRIAPFYTGPVGFDMFIYKAPGGKPRDSKNDVKYLLNPCCEINLRYTMGFVALELMKKHLPEGFQGELTVSDHVTLPANALMLNPATAPFRFKVSEGSY